MGVLRISLSRILFQRGQWIGHIARGLITLSIVLIWGCAGKPVIVDYDPSVSFSYYRLYTLDPMLAASDSTLNDERIKKAVMMVMGQKRYQIVDSEKADIRISWQIKPEVQQYHHHGIGLGLGYGMFYGNSRLRLSMEAHPSSYQRALDRLQIDVVDNKTSKVVWSGVSKRSLRKTGSPSERAQQIQQIVSEVLLSFPSKK